jgi:hypothetical protein
VTGQPHGIPGLLVRLGFKWAGVWLGNEWRAAPDPSGSVAVTPACSPRCTKVSCGFRGQLKVLDEMRLRVTAAGHGLAGCEIPQRLASGFLTVAPRDPLGLLSRGSRKKSDDARGVVGAAAGAATTVRRRCGRPIQSGRVLHGVACAQGEPQWVNGLVETGHATGFTAEPGSLPWAAASTAPAVGWRKSDGVSMVCSG